jgi:hypothetical protein
MAMSYVRGCSSYLRRADNTPIIGLRAIPGNFPEVTDRYQEEVGIVAVGCAT